VVEHQALDLAVGRAAPVAAGDERPADLDFAALELVAVVRLERSAGQSRGRRTQPIFELTAPSRICENPLRCSDRAPDGLPRSGVGAGGEQFRPVVCRDGSDGDAGPTSIG